MADDFAGFVDNGPAAPPQSRGDPLANAPLLFGATPRRANNDPFAGFTDLGPNSKPRLSIAASRSALAGMLDTASAGFWDEIYGLSEASGLPGFLGGLRAPVGAARLTQEQNRGQIGFGGTYFGGSDKVAPGGLSSLVTGDTRGPIEKTYEEARDVARKVRSQAEEDNPRAYLGGQVAGAVVTPGLAGTKGATVGARALRSAVTGGVQGALYGAGSGETPQERVTGAAEGGALGAVGGAVISPVADVAGVGLQKVGQLAKSTYDTLRAELNPQVGRRIVEDEAAKRIVASYPEKGVWSPEEITTAERAGIPSALIDAGDERTLALARSAANQSPEARAALTTFAQDRFAGQTRRAAGFIKDLTGGADAAGDLEAIKERARIINRPRYFAAYREGDRPIWSPELERLASASPSIQAAMKSAINTGRDRAAKEGLGAFNPAIQVTQDGRIAFAKTPSGSPIYPNIQYWDYVQRDLKDMASKVEGRENDKAATLNGLHKALNDELDRLVPSFQSARQGAWKSFQAEDALEAGRNFVTATGKNSDYGQILSKISNPADKELFARGFASNLADRVLELRDNQNVINQSFLGSPAAKQRIAMALGPDRARQLEVYLRAEALSDRLRTALGNSTTARQLAEMGLAGAGTLALGHGAIEGEWDAKHALTAALLFGAAYGKHRAQALDVSVARRLGEMLTSDNPDILNRGVQMVAKSQKLTGFLREAGDRISAALAGRITPTLATSAVVNEGGAK